MWDPASDLVEASYVGAQLRLATSLTTQTCERQMLIVVCWGLFCYVVLLFVIDN